MHLQTDPLWFTQGFFQFIYALISANALLFGEFQISALMENILGLNCSIFESNSYGVVYCMQDNWNWFITLVQNLTCPLAGMIVFESNMISKRVTIWAISIRLRGTARRKNQWRWDNAWMQRSDPETFICARVRLLCSSFEKRVVRILRCISGFSSIPQMKLDTFLCFCTSFSQQGISARSQTVLRFTKIP